MAGTKLTILGCGGSLGVPLWGHIWGECNPDNPKNRRFRTAAFVEYQGKKFLIDSGPDLRQQALQHNIDKVDAVLYTHTHSDHIGGIDELRGLYWCMRQNGALGENEYLNVYGSNETIADVKARYPYLVPGGDNELYKAFLDFHVIAPGQNIIRGCDIQAILQDHTTCQPYGYRFGDVAYTTDVKNFPRESLDMLQGIRHWIISCPFMINQNHPTHADIDQVFAWIDYVKPERAYLTHLGQQTDYDALAAICPPNVEPCYDGMVIAS